LPGTSVEVSWPVVYQTRDDLDPISSVVLTESKTASDNRDWPLETLEASYIGLSLISYDFQR